MALGRFNFNSGSSSKGLFPIYQQLTEPSKKEGLWIKTNNKLKNIYLGYETEDIGQTWFELYEFTKSPSNVINIDDNIYLLGGPESDTTQNRKNIKYDVQQNIYTELATLPSKFYNGSVVAIGTNIYILGGRYNSTQNIKYDTLTNTYTELKKIPYGFSNGSAVVVNNEIHLIGGSAGAAAGIKTHYKYDIATDTYTQLADLPIEFRFGQAVYIDNYIYLFNVYGGSSETLKYNVLEDVYTATGTMPYSSGFPHSFIATFGHYVYLGFYKSDFNTLFEYDTLTNAFEEFQSLWPNSSIYKCTIINTDIYIFDSTNKKIYKLMLDPTYLPGIYLTFDLNPTEIKRYLIKDIYKTITRVETFSENAKLNYETYIGEGTTWNLLEGD